MKKDFFDTVNWNLVSDKAFRIYSDSDPIGARIVFGNCKSIEEINEIAEEIYEELYSDLEDDN